MESASLRDEAIRLVESLPVNFTWDDLMHEIYVRQAIDAGLAASREGRVIPSEEVRARFERRRS